MKNMKKIAVFLLATMMVLSMSITSFAAEKAARTSTVGVSFVVQDVPDGASLAQVPTVLNHNYTVASGDTAFTAIKEAAETLNSQCAVVTGEDNSGKYFSSIFGLSTINDYEDTDGDGYSDYWEGYSWNIVLTVEKADGSTVTFDSPYYASNVNLGVSQHFANQYDSTFPECDGTVTSIKLVYKMDSMSW